MGKKQEDFIREFHAAWGDGTAITKPDVEKILSMMADDAEWQLWVPGGPVIKGKEALRKEIEHQSQIATQNKCNEVNILSSDRMVMQERSDTAYIMGKWCPHDLLAVYELDEDGRIKKWREYLDMADLTKKWVSARILAGPKNSKPEQQRRCLEHKLMAQKVVAVGRLDSQRNPYRPDGS